MAPTKKTKTPVAKADLELELSKELNKLAQQVENLKKMEFIQILGHPWRLMGYSFLKGVAAGFGSVIGASVVVGIFIYLLSKISLVPIVGDFFTEIQNEVNSNLQTTQIK